MDLTWRRLLRAVGTAALIGAAFVVVGLAARSLPAAPAGSPWRLDTRRLGEWVVPLLQVAYLAVLASALYHWLAGREEGPEGRGRRRISPAATLLALMLLAVVTYLVFRLRGDILGNPVFPVGDPAGEPEPAGGLSEGGGVASPPADGVVASPDGLVAAAGWWALTGLAVVIALALAATRRRAEPPVEAVPAPPATPERQRVKPTASIPAADPRSRVFAAYADVEAMVAGRPLARSANETVGSHLARLPSSSPAPRALAAAYNRARFSPHAITEAHASVAESARSSLLEELA